jgi:hypothetical protein
MPIPSVCNGFLLFILIFACTGEKLLAQTQSDVRQIRWGMSRPQVREAESQKPTSVRKDKLVYSRTPLNDRTVGLEYDFNGDSLLSATYYYYATVSITKADVLAAFSEFESALTEKYGPGKKRQTGESREIGWLTPRTQVTLALGNVDRGWSTEIIYLCRVCGGGPQPVTTWKARKEVKDF